MAKTKTVNQNSLVTEIMTVGGVNKENATNIFNVFANARSLDLIGTLKALENGISVKRKPSAPRKVAKKATVKTAPKAVKTAKKVSAKKAKKVSAKKPITALNTKTKVKTKKKLKAKKSKAVLPAITSKSSTATA